MQRPPPRSRLFPYTTLFRSKKFAITIVVGFYILSLLFNFLTGRSEEHTSELQSRGHLVCSLLLEKKNLVITLAAAEQGEDSSHGLILLAMLSVTHEGTWPDV